MERGFTFRPLAVTTKDTLDFHFSRPLERRQQLRAGISAKREAEVLAAWHAANGQESMPPYLLPLFIKSSFRVKKPKHDSPVSHPWI